MDRCQSPKLFWHWASLRTTPLSKTKLLSPGFVLREIPTKFKWNYRFCADNFWNICSGDEMWWWGSGWIEITCKQDAVLEVPDKLTGTAVLDPLCTVRWWNLGFYVPRFWWHQYNRRARWKTVGLDPLSWRAAAATNRPERRNRRIAVNQRKCNYELIPFHIGIRLNKWNWWHSSYIYFSFVDFDWINR